MDPLCQVALHWGNDADSSKSLKAAAIFFWKTVIRAHNSRKYVGWHISRTSRGENSLSQKLVAILAPGLHKCATSSAIPWQKLCMSDDQRNSFSGVNEYNKNHNYGLTFLTLKSLPDFISFMSSVVCSPKKMQNTCLPCKQECLQENIDTCYTVNKCFPQHMRSRAI